MNLVGQSGVSGDIVGIVQNKICHIIIYHILQKFYPFSIVIV